MVYCLSILVGAPAASRKAVGLQITIPCSLGLDLALAESDRIRKICRILCLHEYANAFLRVLLSATGRYWSHLADGEVEADSG